MNIFDEINLPQSSKYLISMMLKKGGKLNAIEGTNAYILKLGKKEYVFLDEFTHLTPYMYGIVFSNQKYWFEILKELKIKHAWEPAGNQKRILLLMTRGGFYNAVLEKNIVITGNGKESLKTLIKNENIKRINSKKEYIMPVTIKGRTIKLNRILKSGEEVGIPENYDFEEVSGSLDKNVVKTVQKIIDYLPGLPFLRLEIYVKDYKHADKFSLGRVLISSGVNIFFKNAGRFLLRSTTREYNSSHD